MRHTVSYLEDVVLVDRCVGGEEAAAQELFRREVRRVHATLFRVIGHNRDMDDLLQEVFIQVFGSLHRYRGEARLSTFIDRIAARAAYRYLRQRRDQRPPVPLEMLAEPVAPQADPDRTAAARQGVKRLYVALEKLSASTRLCWTLHEIDGRPMVEVARIAGMSVTATKVRVWRARRILRREAAADPVLAEFLAGGDVGPEPQEESGE